jgi:hypothetical protein
VSDAPNLIDLLSRQDPDALALLRDRYPAQTQLLSSERLLGREAAASPPERTPRLRCEGRGGQAIRRVASRALWLRCNHRHVIDGCPQKACGQKP